MNRTRRRRGIPMMNQQRQLPPAVEKILMMGRDQLEMDPFSSKVWHFWANEFHRINFLPQNARSLAVSRHLIDVPDDGLTSQINPKVSSRVSLPLPPERGQRDRSKSTSDVKLDVLTVKKEEIVKEPPKVITTRDVESDVDFLKKKIKFLTDEIENKNKELSKTQQQWFEMFKSAHLVSNDASKLPLKSASAKVEIQLKHSESLVKELRNKITTLEKQILEIQQNDNHRRTQIDLLNSEKAKILSSSDTIVEAIRFLSRLELELSELSTKFQVQKDTQTLESIIQNLDLSIRVVKNLHFKAVEIWGKENINVKSNENSSYAWIKEKEIFKDELEKLKKENARLRGMQTLRPSPIVRSVSDYITAKY